MSELPEPSPELILLVALIQAQMRVLSKKDQERFLLTMAQSIGAQAAATNLVQLRRRSEDPRVLRATREAQAFWLKIITVALKLE